MRKLSSLIVLLLCGAAPSYTQQTSDSGQSIGPHPLTLDVIVSAKSGTPVAGLQQNDFTLLDNKHPREIRSFRAVEANTADAPVEIILLIDEVNAPFSAVANMRIQLKKYLRENGGSLPHSVSLILFSDSDTKIVNPSRDGNVLVSELDRIDTAIRTSRRSQGVYGAADRMQISIRALGSLAAFEEKKPGKKILIWLSPGWASLSGPRIQLTSKDHQLFFNTIVAAATALRQARVTLYSIDPQGAAEAGSSQITYYTTFLKPIRKADNAEGGDLMLPVLAEQSGGRVLNSNNDIAGEIRTCAADADNYYILSFDPLPADGPNDFHSFEIKIDKPGLTARTRAGYYAQP